MKRASRIALVAAAIALVPFLAFGLQSPPQVTPVGYTNVSEFVALLNVIIQWLFYILLVVAVLILIWAAFTYLTAGGDEEKIGKAKNMIIGAVIALVIAFVASGIPTLVGNFLGTP